jgi:hypothetical protein
MRFVVSRSIGLDEVESEVLQKAARLFDPAAVVAKVALFYGHFEDTLSPRGALVSTIV